jgi:hypothetical protein
MNITNIVISATLLLSSSASAFVVPSSSTTLTRSLRMSAPLEEESSDLVRSFQVVTTAATTAFLTNAAPAMAAGPDWGIFEGRTGSLLHPVMMGSLLLYTLYTAFLGFQWRRQRTLGGDIKELQAQLPSGISSKADIEKAMKEEGADMMKLKTAMPIAEQVAELQNERKELAAAAPRDQHFSQGALLAFLGTAFAIEVCLKTTSRIFLLSTLYSPCICFPFMQGPLNTYARAGKLFPGPHLYAGAGLVVVWALAVATIPAMQKGSDTARSIHIGANVAGLGLFLWQLQSGIPILLKVIEKTSWP